VLPSKAHIAFGGCGLTSSIAEEMPRHKGNLIALHLIDEGKHQPTVFALTLQKTATMNETAEGDGQPFDMVVIGAGNTLTSPT
jgi:hypothetical protein